MIFPRAGVKVILVATLALLIATLAIPYWLLATEGGSRWLLARLGGENLHVGRVSGTWSRGLQLQQLRVDGEWGSATLAEASGRWQLASLLRGQFIIARLAAKDVDVHLNTTSEPGSAPTPWPSLSLPLAVNVEHLTIARLTLYQGENTTPIKSLKLAAHSTPLRSHIRELELHLPEGAITLAGQFNNRFPYPLSLQGKWQFQDASGAGTLNGSLLNLALDHHLQSPLALASTGTLILASQNAMGWNSDAIHLKLANQWQDQAVGEHLVSGGDLVIEGNLAHYSLQGTGQLSPVGQTTVSSAQPASGGVAALPLPPVAIELVATGNGDGLEVQSLSLDTEEGTAKVAGSLNWRDGLRWQANLAAQNITLATLLPNWPALLSASASSEGHWQRGQWQADATLSELSGTVAKYAVGGVGKVAVQGSTKSRDFRARLDGIELTVGNNKLQLDGTLGQQAALNWQLNGENLSALHPALAGSLQGEGQLRGAWPAVQIAGQVRADNLSMAGAAVTRAHLALTPIGDTRQQLVLTANGVSYASIANSDLHLAIDGLLVDRQWQGTVAQLSATNPDFGSWRLAQPSALLIGGDEFRLSPLCLQQQQSQICAQMLRKGDSFNAKGGIENLDLKRFNSFLPMETTLAGSAAGNLDIAFSPAGYQGSFQFGTSAASLRQTLGRDQLLTREFDLAGTGTIENDTLRGEANLTLADTGELTLALNLGLTRPQALDGQIQGNLTNLAWLGALTDVIANPQGSMSANLKIGGSAQAPTLSGTLTASDLAAAIPPLGTQVANGTLTLSVPTPDRWQLAGSLDVGDGQLTVDAAGALPWRSDSLELHLQGNDLQLVDLPDSQITASPDISLRLHRQQANITGTLAIPRARLFIRPAPEGITSLSEDEEIYPATSVQKAKPYPIISALELQLGKDVHLEAFGLVTGLKGNLQLHHEGEGLPQAQGTVSLVKGRYQAYGQKLKVKKGVLIFQGAIDNPGLNITATRETPYATAGVDIGGTLQDIRSRVFSDPALPESDALAVLVTGKPLASAAAGDANLMANAAASLGIAKSGWLTSQLREQLGVDVFTLESGDTYQDSSLVVGKYLSPELFVSYIQNLFDAQSSVALQYRLGEKLGLKAQSGEQQSLDLQYRIEH